MAGGHGDRVDAVVLAGGRGTRSTDPSRAKVAQELGGRSLMAWHLRLLERSRIDRAIVVAGHLGDQVQDLCDSVAADSVAVDVVHEAEQRGTVAALKLAAVHSTADAFLVILGDILLSFPVDDFLDAWAASGAPVAVVVHPSTHPEDSDAAFTSHDGSVVVVPKGQRRSDVPNMSSAGVFATTRGALATYGGLRDLGSDVLAAAAADGDLLCFTSSHYFRDTGTPDRLERAKADVDSGTFHARGRIEPRPALFLDRDGVINPAEPEAYDPSDYTLLAGVADRIKEANRKGIPVFVVTNQPGIAKGFMTFAEHESVRARMDTLLGRGGAFVDDYLFCPHHPERGFDGELVALKRVCECRKPGIGMAKEIQTRHRISLERSVMVGDTDFDRGFARGAGMRFIHVSPPHPDTDAEDCVPEAAEAISRGIEVLTC